MSAHTSDWIVRMAYSNGICFSCCADLHHRYEVVDFHVACELALDGVEVLGLEVCVDCVVHSFAVVRVFGL